MIAILIGILFAGAGLWGLVHWMPDLLVVVRGLGPISIFLGGIIGVMAGISSLQSRRKSNVSKGK